MLDTALLAHDPGVPQRDRLLDAEVMRHHVDRLLGKPGIAPPVARRIKYRVGESLRIVYSVPLADSPDALVTVRTTTSQPTSGCAAVPDLSALLWKFPRDRRLTRLDALLAPAPDIAARLGGAWVGSRLVGYAPEKCAVVACLDAANQPIAYAKSYAHTGEAANAFALSDRLWKAAIGRPLLRLARPIAFHVPAHVVITQAARGIRLTACGPERAERAVAMLGAAAAQLHALPPPPSLAVLDRSTPRALMQTATIIGRVRPSLAGRATMLADDLIARTPEPGEAGLLHGDLHLKNALLDEQDLWLIDLDQAGSGPAALDIGSFLALLRTRAMTGLLAPRQAVSLERAFLDGYASVRRLPSGRDLAWHTAAALLGERALRAITRMRIPVLRSLDLLLDESHQLLLRGGGR